LTQPGVNALKISYKNPFGVIATLFSVQHLLDEKLLIHIETQMTYVSSDGETEATALYQITNKGRELTEKWILLLRQLNTRGLSFPRRRESRKRLDAGSRPA
jgi:hypothetical protein